MFPGVFSAADPLGNVYTIFPNILYTMWSLQRRAAPTSLPEQHDKITHAEMPKYRRRGRRPRRPMLGVVRNLKKRVMLKLRKRLPLWGAVERSRSQEKAPPLGELSSEARLKGSHRSEINCCRKPVQEDRCVPPKGSSIPLCSRWPPFASLRSAPPPEGEALPGIRSAHFFENKKICHSEPRSGEESREQNSQRNHTGSFAPLRMTGGFWSLHLIQDDSWVSCHLHTLRLSTGHFEKRRWRR